VPLDKHRSSLFKARYLPKVTGFSEADLRAAGCVAIYRDPADLLRNYDSSPLAEA
jgi:hypothetical protein